MNTITPYSIWRHVRTGRLYVVLGIALDSTNEAPPDLYSVVYRHCDTGTLYYRHVEEFLDGRFRKETV